MFWSRLENYMTLSHKKKLTANKRRGYIYRQPNEERQGTGKETEKER